MFRGCAADARIFLGVPGESVAANFRCDSSKSDAFVILCAAMHNQARVLLYGDAVLDYAVSKSRASGIVSRQRSICERPLAGKLKG